MSDLPPGVFSEILVGQHWPSDSVMAAVRGASANRGGAHAEFSSFADQLRLIQSGPLASQQGITADRIRDTFDRGEQTAQGIAEANGVKKGAYDTAHNVADELRDALATIAEDGNTKINQIQNSKGTFADKVAQITDVVVDAQTRAAAKAATCAGEILDAMQGIFTKQGLDSSAREFAKDHGLDTSSMFQAPNKEDIQTQVSGILQHTDLPQSPVPTVEGQHFQGGSQGDETPSPTRPAPVNSPTEVFAHGAAGNEAVPAANVVVTSPPERVFGQGLQGNRDTPPPVSNPLPNPTAKPAIPSPSAPTLTATPVAPHVAPPANPVTAPPPAPAAPLPTAANPPPTLLQSFEHGLQSGSAVPQGLITSPPVASPVEPHLSSGVTGAPPPLVAHSPGLTAPAFDTPPAPTPEPAAPYLAAPAPPVIPSVVASPPPISTGPLPGYGADLRTPAAAPTAPAAPVSPAPPAAPASSPGGGVGQPAVVRRTPPPQSPVGIAEQAVAATTGGAVAGAVSADSAARTRLQRLVDAVARREPRLRWAAGERADGTTVLVTDLAGGWIPPHVDVPAGMHLLDPAHRRGDPETLLGAVTVVVSYLPGQHLPAPDHDEPIPTSPRARYGPVVAELGWELRQATAWRDGLPRLAHTLVKATCAGTGVLDSETALLREHLGVLRDRVLCQYPDGIVVDALANWQLLAAIDALLGQDRGAAMYHFAWFQTLSADRGTG